MRRKVLKDRTAESHRRRVTVYTWLRNDQLRSRGITGHVILVRRINAREQAVSSLNHSDYGTVKTEVRWTTQHNGQGVNGDLVQSLH